MDGYSLDDNRVRKKNPHRSLTTKTYSFVLDKLEHFESDVSVAQSVQIMDRRGAQLLAGVTSLRFGCGNLLFIDCWITVKQ